MGTARSRTSIPHTRSASTDRYTTVPEWGFVGIAALHTRMCITYRTNAVRVGGGVRWVHSASTFDARFVNMTQTPGTTYVPLGCEVPEAVLTVTTP